jgi:hypothetical protein
VRVILTILLVIGAGAAAAGAYVTGLTPRLLNLAQVADTQPAASPAPAPVAFPVSNAIGKADRMVRDLSLPFAPAPVFEPLGNHIPRGAAESVRSVQLAPPQWRQALARAEKPTNILLNEAQINSIRERLQLSPEQQRLWPEAENALRQLVTQLYRAQKNRNVSAPGDAEIADIKAKAAPFLASLTGRQRNDIRLLAAVAGIDTAMLGL